MIFAPEVVIIEFAYFNGTEWLPSWDSAEAGRLPVAVEVAVEVRPIRADAGDITAPRGTSLLELVPAEENRLVYRRLVPLPITDSGSGGGR